MTRFNHNKIVADILNQFPNLMAIEQQGNKAFEFEDKTDQNMPVGRLEIIPATKSYLYTVYLSFYDAKYLNIKDSILNAYKEQKKLFTIPFNAIIEDRNENKATII
jgi:hypothetical protein